MTGTENLTIFKSRVSAFHSCDGIGNNKGSSQFGV